jgi:hypothetical protein
MPRREIEMEGRRWSVRQSGRRTQYARDEFGLIFSSLDGEPEQRVARYTPLAVKSSEMALSALTDAQLVELLGRSQPSWTSPELGYRR